MHADAVSMQPELGRELVRTRRTPELAEASEQPRSGRLCKHVAGNLRDVHRPMSFAQYECVNQRAR